MGRHGSVRRPNPVASPPEGVATRTETTGDPPPRSTIPLATWSTSATAEAMHPSRATMASSCATGSPWHDPSAGGTGPAELHRLNVSVNAGWTTSTGSRCERSLPTTTASRSLTSASVPSGDPLLLIMGIGADMLYRHDDFCNPFARNGFQVARFANRDCGESTPPRLGGHAGSSPGAPASRHRPYRLEDMADDAAAVLDALGSACLAPLRGADCGTDPRRNRG